jgi:hypothetical protein
LVTCALDQFHRACTHLGPPTIASANSTRAGDLDPRLAATLGQLGAGLLKAIEQTDMEKRLAALENAWSKQLLDRVGFGSPDASGARPQ